MGKSTTTAYGTLVVHAAPGTFSSAASRCDKLLAVRLRVGRHDHGAGSARVTQIGRFAGDGERGADVSHFVNFRGKLT